MPTTLTIGGHPVTIGLEDLGANAITEAIDDQGQVTASVVMRCYGADRYDVFRALKGTTQAVGRSIIRTVPFLYPPSPNLVCMSIGGTSGIKPYRDSSGWIQYEIVQFTANFGRPKYDYTNTSPDGQNDPSGQPWTTTKFKVSAEIITPPSGTFYIGPFPGAKKTEEASVGIIKANVEISMTRHFLPYVPLDDIMNASSFLNLYPVQFADRVFPKGNLLFISADTDPKNDPAGNFAQEVTYTIMGKTNDWNQFISNDGSLQYLNSKADGTGTNPYSYIDFSLIP